MKLLKIMWLGPIQFALTALNWAQATFPDHCAGSVPLLFAAIEVKHPIDSACGLQGSPGASANSHTQNLVENDFCATGTPQPFTPQMLIDLQTSNHIPSGNGLEPTDRSRLKTLGKANSCA